VPLILISAICLTPSTSITEFIPRRNRAKITFGFPIHQIRDLNQIGLARSLCVLRSLSQPTLIYFSQQAP